MSEMPVRVRRERSSGWRMPENTVYVGRPGRFCNPHKVTDECAAAEAVELFEQTLATGVGWRHSKYHAPPSPETIRESLGGKNLACWCPLDQPCHADVLLRIANEGPAKTERAPSFPDALSPQDR